MIVKKRKLTCAKFHFMAGLCFNWRTSAIFSSIRRIWICSRNDIIANSGVIVAGILVYLFQNNIADLLVGLIITLVFLKSGLLVIKESLPGLKQGEGP